MSCWRLTVVNFKEKNVIYTQEELKGMSIHTLRVILRSDFKGVPGTNSKQELIRLILKIQAGEEIPVRSTKGRKPLEATATFEKELTFSDNGDVHNFETGFIKGVFEKHADGFGYVLRNGVHFSKKDVFVRETFVKRLGLKTGDFVEGAYDGCGDRGGYVLKGVDFINGKNADSYDLSESLLKVKPADAKINLATDTDYILNAVETFCPIGEGQRCLVKTSDNAYATDFIKRAIEAVKENDKDLSVTALLVGVKPEICADFEERFKDCVISVDYNENLEKSVRICNLAIQSVKERVRSGDRHVLIIDRLSSLHRLLKEYLESAQNEKYLPSAISAERFIIDCFGCGANYGEKGSLTVIATVGDLEDSLYKSLSEISNSVICFKGEGKVRKRSYRLDVANSWSESDELFNGAQKTSKIDDLRDEMCQSLEKENEIWQKFKNFEIKI